MPTRLPSGSSGLNSWIERESVLNSFSDITNPRQIKPRRLKEKGKLGRIPHWQFRGGALGFLMVTGQTRPHFSLLSLIALAAAIASFFVSAGGGFILAIGAIAFGLIGVMLSFSPS